MNTPVDSVYLSHTAIQQHQQQQTSFRLRFLFLQERTVQRFCEMFFNWERFLRFDPNGLNSLTAYKNIISLVLVY